MAQQTIRCDECGSQNRLPSGWFIEAHCRVCENPLTTFAVVIGVLRNRVAIRTLQLVAALVILVVMFGGDVADWWRSEPFRLDAGTSSSEAQADPGQSELPSTSLVFDQPETVLEDQSQD